MTSAAPARTMISSRAFFLSRAKENRLASVGAVIGVLVIGSVLVGPLVWQKPVETQDLAVAFQLPSTAHPFGLDQYGRDVLGRILVGGRASLVIGIGSVAAALVPGVIAGVLAATLGNWFSAVIMRLTDALLAVPQVVLAVILVSTFGFGLGPLLVALSVSTVPVFVRVSYASALSVLQRDFVASAKCSGLGSFRISLSHVVPNVASPVLAVGTMRTGGNLIIGAGLNFFGLGVQPPAPEWGLMISEAQTYAYNHPLLMVFPGACILLASLSFNLIGDGLRDWLDPQMRDGAK